MAKLKTINIKGKEYVPVHERILHFNEKYPNGKIVTEMLSEIGSPIVLFKATVWPDVEKPERFFTGYSQEKEDDGYINKTSAIENSETSAVGRCLGMMGIGVLESVASSDEIVKAHNAEEKQHAPKKVCPVCKKPHDGPYQKCYKCWPIEKKGKEVEVVEESVNKEPLKDENGQDIPF